MLIFFKRPEFSSRLFVISSLAAFVIAGAFYFIFRLSFSGYQRPPAGAQDKYYLSSSYKSNDPFITKNPGLKDILAGPIISTLDPGQGRKDAPVAIVVFSDYLCSYCRGHELVFKQILQKYQDKIRLIWKDYPESDITSISFQAAVAARCADQQNKFMSYREKLYSQDNLKAEYLMTAAQEIGLNMEAFSECLKSGRVIKLINDNIIEADALGITGVPFIYVNDQAVIGEITYEELAEMVEIELDKLAK